MLLVTFRGIDVDKAAVGIYEEGLVLFTRNDRTSTAILFERAQLIKKTAVKDRRYSSLSFL